MNYIWSIKNSVWFAVTLSALVLMWPAFYNGFPIVYSDTSTYISSGFELETPTDRPITYGLFILLTSFNGFSLWTVVFFQSLILAYTVYLFIKYFTNCTFPQYTTFVAVLILSFITGLAWVSGMLLADVFTPVTIITLLLLLFAKNLSKKENAAVYILFFLSNAMHMSHLMINVLLLISIIFITRMPYFKSIFLFTSLKKLFILLFISLSGIVIMSSAMSKSKHIFYMGHMVENGILKKYLDENCATHNYKICTYKDSLPPNADRFLWDFKNSPVYKMGGWNACKSEFNTIIYETFSKPEYIKLHAVASIKGTWHQLTAFTIGEGNVSFGKETTLYERIKKYIPGNIKSYSESKQTNNELSLFNSFNLSYKISVYASLFFLLFMICIKGLREKITSQQVVVIAFVLSGIIYNDFICATLSTIANRFACRIMWLLPLLLLTIICNNLTASKKE